MSAFVVNNTHINAMLQSRAPTYPGESRPSYYWQGEQHHIGNGTGQKLVDENARSVKYRYKDSTEPYVFKAVPFMRPRFSPVEIIKACDCYRYQSCETPDWKETEAYAIMTALRERAIKHLSGYEEAAWEVPPA